MDISTQPMDFMVKLIKSIGVEGVSSETKEKLS